MTQEKSPAVVPAGEPSEAISLWNLATEAARLCKEIVLKTSRVIGDRKYVQVEGWTAIATVHGCVTTIKSVDSDATGVRAVAELRRIRDNKLLSSAEGFVGSDEPVWYGGTVTKWDRKKNKEITRTLPKRPEFAIRAMAQTRATSRVCRGPFSHVVVIIGEGLMTTPAEEIRDDEDDFTDVETREASPAPATPDRGGAADTTTTRKPIEVPRDEAVKLRAQFEGRKWEHVVIHFGQDKGTTLGEMPPKKLSWWMNDWVPAGFGGKPPSENDVLLRAALDAAKIETADDER